MPFVFPTVRFRSMNYPRQCLGVRKRIPNITLYLSSRCFKDNKNEYRVLAFAD